MDPARLSITHTADSSMKKVICEAGEEGRRGERENAAACASARSLPIRFESSCTAAGPAAEVSLSDISRRTSARMSEGINNQILRRVPQSEDEINPNYRKAFHLMTRETIYQLLMEGCFLSSPTEQNMLVTSPLARRASPQFFTARTFAFSKNDDNED